MSPKLKLVREALAECFKANPRPLTRDQVLDWIGKEYKEASLNETTLVTQLYRSCINVKSAKNSSAPKILNYDRATRMYVPLSLAPLASTDTKIDVGSNASTTYQFALEAHLRDYLAKNLSILEAGLTLWNGITAESVEYDVGGRRIDILAKDASGVPVVVELKLSKGHERTLGQALYYRGKLKQSLKVSRVRIIMVAAEITDELRIASMEVSDVDVFSYKLSMQVQKVDLSPSSLDDWVPS
jgi:hypothetical protein